MKENIKKTCRLIYIITLVVVSLFSFVIPITYKSWVGDLFVHDLYKNAYTEYYFLKCKYEWQHELKSKLDTSYRPTYLLEKCGKRIKNIEIDGTLINAKKYQKSGSYQYHTTNHKIIERFNNQNKNVAVIKNLDVTDDEASYKATLISMWLAFIISLPLIWISRNTSISIVSLIIKVWKKI